MLSFVDAMTTIIACNTKPYTEHCKTNLIQVSNTVIKKYKCSYPGKAVVTVGRRRDKEQKGKGKVQGVPQSQAAALPRHEEEEETDKTKQA